jgi:hypothetical protein
MANNSTDMHNVWTEDLNEDETGLQMVTKLFKSFNEAGKILERIEVELIINYLDEEKDEKVDLDDLKKAKKFEPFKVVARMVESFGRIHTNDDGKLSKVSIWTLVHRIVDISMQSS